MALPFSEQFNASRQSQQASVDVAPFLLPQSAASIPGECPLAPSQINDRQSA
jgi:hypothetical protein